MKRSDFLVIAGALSESSNVTLQPGDGWAADVKTKRIFYPSAAHYFTEEDIALVGHECGHLRFTDELFNLHEAIDLLGKKHGKKAEQIFWLLNAVEDRRVDRLMVQEFLGLDQYYEITYNKIIPEMVDHIDYDAPEESDAFWYKQLARQFCWGLTVPEINWLEPRHDAEVQDRLDPRVREALENVPSISHVHEYETTHELFEFLVDEILEHYLPFCEDWDEKKEEEQQKKDREQLKKDMKDVLKALAKLLKAARKAAQKAQQAKDKADAEKGEGEPQEDEDGDQEGDGEGDGEGEGEGEPKPEQLGEQKLERMAGPAYVEKPVEQGSDEEAEKAVASVFGNMGALRSKLRDPNQKYSPRELLALTNKNVAKTRKAISTLKDKAITRFEPGHRSGTIDKRRIVKLYANNTRIFKKRRDVGDSNDISLSMLIDISGSMEGERIRVAAGSIAILAKAAELSGKPFSVHAFDNGYRLIKGFDKKLSYQGMADLQSMCQGGTSLGYGAHRLHEYLAKRSHKKNVIIVATDGESSPYGGQDDDGNDLQGYELSKEMKALHSDSRNEVYGICIGRDMRIENFKRLFKNAIQVEDVNLFPDELYKIFKAVAGKK